MLKKEILERRDESRGTFYVKANEMPHFAYWQPNASVMPQTPHSDIWDISIELGYKEDKQAH
ncbi:MAG: hypothetical protein ABIK92_03485 [Pseudomonadota bacterium]